METPSSKTVIYEKIAAVMKEIGPIEKGRRNQQQGYNFRGIDELMNAINPVLAKHGIFPTCAEIQSVLDESVTSRNGGAGYREIRRYRFEFFASDGSSVSTWADGEAIDYGDKGSNKAYSVAYREAMFKIFVVPFENDDIENTEHDIAPRRAPGATISVPAKSAKDAQVSVGKTIDDQKGLIADLIHKAKGRPTAKTPSGKRKFYADAALELTQLDLIEENYQLIIDRLTAAQEEREEVEKDIT